MPMGTREAQRAYQLEWVTARRAEFFSNKACTKCGSTSDLELDHVEPGLKVSHRVWSWSGKRRLEELSKCQVLCHSCHKVKTHTDRPVPPHGTCGRYKRGCRCEDCRAWNAARVRGQRQRTNQ